jgi:hypothetical protein
VRGGLGEAAALYAVPRTEPTKATLEGHSSEREWDDTSARASGPDGIQGAADPGQPGPSAGGTRTGDVVSWACIHENASCGICQLVLFCKA